MSSTARSARMRWSVSAAMTARRLVRRRSARRFGPSAAARARRAAAWAAMVSAERGICGPDVVSMMGTSASSGEMPARLGSSGSSGRGAVVVVDSAGGAVVGAGSVGVGVGPGSVVGVVAVVVEAVGSVVVDSARQRGRRRVRLGPGGRRKGGRPDRPDRRDEPGEQGEHRQCNRRPPRASDRHRTRVLSRRRRRASIGSWTSG